MSLTKNGIIPAAISSLIASSSSSPRNLFLLSALIDLNLIPPSKPARSTDECACAIY